MPWVKDHPRLAAGTAALTEGGKIRRIRAFLEAYGIEFDERYGRAKALAAFQAAFLWGFPTQGIGLRPRPWSGFSRPRWAGRAAGGALSRAVEGGRGDGR